MLNECEIWYIVKDYNKYQVSNLGRVRSIDRIVTMKNGKKRFFNSKILQEVINSKGYSVVSLYDKNNKRTVMRVHRLVAEVFVEGKTKIRNQVNHKDGNKQNNLPSNLEWCSQYENNHHGYKNNLIVALKGEKQPQAKLNKNQILEIRELLKTSDLTQRKIAEMYNVTEFNISKIKRGITYVSEV